MERQQLERNIISSVFSDNELFDDLVETARPDYFKDNISREIYKWMLKKYKAAEKISVISASGELDVDVMQVIDSNMPIFEFEGWLKQLNKLHTQSTLKASAKKIYELAGDESKSIDEYMAEAQEIVFKATSNFAESNDDFTLGDALMEAYQAYIEEKENGKVSGIKTGFPSVDNNVGGLHDGHLTMLAGSTSMGKSAFSLSLTNNLIKNGKKVHFVSLEMNSKELADRLLIMNSNVRANDYNKRKLNEVQEKALNSARSQMVDYEDNLVISEKRGLTVEEIKANCRKQFKKLDTDLIIIDYLQRIRLKGEKTVNKEVGSIANSIRDLAGELKVPIILLSQLNRSVQGRPKLKHLRDSGEIEEAADEVWFVYRPAYYKSIDEQKEDYRQEAELIHAKGRVSGVGKSHFYFYPDLTLWRDRYLEDSGKKHPISLLTYKKGAKNGL